MLARAGRWFGSFWPFGLESSDNGSENGAVGAGAHRAPPTPAPATTAAASTRPRATSSAPWSACRRTTKSTSGEQFASNGLSEPAEMRMSLLSALSESVASRPTAECCTVGDSEKARSTSGVSCSRCNRRREQLRSGVRVVLEPRRGCRLQ